MKCYAYLDIETIGLSKTYAELTVVGVALVKGPQSRIDQLVAPDISVDSLLALLHGADEIYTYNGSRFDLPFIKAQLDIDLKQHFKHTDLMYACWKQNLKGGLKVVEQRLGMPRKLKGITGYIAVHLWWQYVNDHSLDALKTLLEYNKEDVLNLEILRRRLGVP
jgi:hypothetical protein